MRKLVEVHPVLRKLPEHIKAKLAVQPGSWSELPANRRTRKRLQRDGFIAHLFAGEDAGFTLARAWHQQGGDSHSLLEIDIKRGPNHVLLQDVGSYPALMRAALEGKLLAVVQTAGAEVFWGTIRSQTSQTVRVHYENGEVVNLEKKGWLKLKPQSFMKMIYCYGEWFSWPWFPTTWKKLAEIPLRLPLRWSSRHHQKTICRRPSHSGIQKNGLRSKRNLLGKKRPFNKEPWEEPPQNPQLLVETWPSRLTSTRSSKKEKKRGD